MNTKQQEVINELRNEGYLIIIWTPEELTDVNDLSSMEDILIERGNNFIEYSKGE